MSLFSSSIVKRIRSYNNLLKHDTTSIVTGRNDGLPGARVLKTNAQAYNVRMLWKDAWWWSILFYCDHLNIS